MDQIVERTDENIPPMEDDLFIAHHDKESSVDDEEFLSPKNIKTGNAFATSTDEKS